MKLLSLIVVLIYTLFPRDLLPDMIPVVGWLDDVALWILFFWYFYLHLRRKDNPEENDAEGRQEFRRESSGYDRHQGFRERTDRRAKPDPYHVLGIEKGAAPDVIKKAYRELAGTYHPDKFAHLGEDFQKTAEARFKEIQEAYQTLMPKA